MSNQARYATIKVLKPTLRLLRQLSFEKDLPILKVIHNLALSELERMGVKPR